MTTPLFVHLSVFELQVEFKVFILLVGPDGLVGRGRDHAVLVFRPDSRIIIGIGQGRCQTRLPAFGFVCLSPKEIKLKDCATATSKKTIFSYFVVSN
jgi:hypothetical protein